MSRNRVLNFIGTNCFVDSLGILIVAPSRFNTSLCTALQEKNSNSRDGPARITLHTSSQVNSLLRLQSEIHFDFIVFVIDTLKQDALKLLDSELRLLDSTYVKMGRVCVVRPRDISYEAGTVDLDELNSWANVRHIPLLHGAIMDKAKCLELAGQLLNLVLRTCGYHTGIPVCIHHTPKDLEYLQTFFPDPQLCENEEYYSV